MLYSARAFGAMLASLLICVGMVRADDPRVPDAPVVAHVKAVSDARPVAIVDQGRTAGIAEFDRVIVFGDADTSGAGVSAAGEVIYTGGDQAGVRWAITESKVLPGNRVLLVPDAWVAARTRDLTRGVNREGRIDSVIIASDLAWLNAGTARGWRAGDGVLVRRGAEVKGWGEIVRAEPEAALLRLRPWPRVSAILRGDLVEQVAAPGESASHSMVTSVREEGESRKIRLAGDSALGLRPGGRVDVFRNGGYIGFAAIDPTSGGVWAEVADALSKEIPQPGDTVRLRPAVDAKARRTGYVFRVEPDYVLATLGEADGVQVGDALELVAAAGERVPLKVKAVYPDHSGAEFDAARANLPADRMVWQRVRTVVQAGAGEAGGQLKSTSATRSTAADWLYLVEDPATPLAVGEVVAVSADPTALAVIVQSQEAGALAVRIPRMQRSGVD